MDVPSRNSDNFRYHKLCCTHAHSLKRSCFLIFLFVIFIVLLLGIFALVIVFGLKPKSPVFAVQTVTLDLYELNSYLDSTMFVSSVITLTLNAHNPNKLGIRYSPARLHLYFEGLPIGTIRVPGFLQPAHSYNMTVPTRVLFQCVNVSHVVAEASRSSRDEYTKSVIQMKILGDIKAQLLAFHVTLLKIKVCCSSRCVN